MTTIELKKRTVKELTALALEKNIPGYNTMRKQELIEAIVAEEKARMAKEISHSETLECLNEPPPQPKKKSKPVSTTASRSNGFSISHDLASTKENEATDEDRLILMVRDPYWLQAYWELTRESINSAKVAFGNYWNAAVPTLRVVSFSDMGATNTGRTIERDITIHGGVNNWYVDVQDPPKQFQVEIGYKLGKRFHVIAKSNLVTTPRRDSTDTLDGNWTEISKDYDRIFAMSGGYTNEQSTEQLREVFEEKMCQPIGDPFDVKFGLGAGYVSGREDLSIEVETELIVHGKTDPSVRLTLGGEPVKLRQDGSFAVQFSLPNKRHVYPIVASTPDGDRQKTVVLSIDRNTRELETVSYSALLE